MRRVTYLIALLVAAPVLVGCGTDRLETGYKPRPLTASENQRRAYYASPFSVEARKAQLEVNRDAGFEKSRPGGRF